MKEFFSSYLPVDQAVFMVKTFLAALGALAILIKKGV